MMAINDYENEAIKLADLNLAEVLFMTIHLHVSFVVKLLSGKLACELISKKRNIRSQKSGQIFSTRYSPMYGNIILSV